MKAKSTMAISIRRQLYTNKRGNVYKHFMCSYTYFIILMTFSLTAPLQPLFLYSKGFFFPRSHFFIAGGQILIVLIQKFHTTVRGKMDIFGRLRIRSPCLSQSFCQRCKLTFNFFRTNYFGMRLINEALF